MIPFLLSVLLLILVSLCYGFRPDACAAITVFPAWAWLPPGLLMLWIGRNLRQKYLPVLTAAMWCTFLFLFAEEPRSLLRFRQWPSRDWQLVRKEGRGLRVISLNCSLGNKDAAAEVTRYQPDIVLLQESPSRSEIELLRQRLFGRQGGTASNIDLSIIARGALEQKRLPLSVAGTAVIQAHLHLLSGLELELLCIRLRAPTVRLDLWSPEAWKDYREEREFRQEQMKDIAAQMATVSPVIPLLAGGDFNAPAGDAIFRVFRPRLHDAFGEGGIGCGNTALNEFPFARIDQIWISEQLKAVGVVVRKTRHSDHRMVIADLLVRP